MHRDRAITCACDLEVGVQASPTPRLEHHARSLQYPVLPMMLASRGVALGPRPRHQRCKVPPSPAFALVLIRRWLSSLSFSCTFAPPPAPHSAIHSTIPHHQPSFSPAGNMHARQSPDDLLGWSDVEWE